MGYLNKKNIYAIASLMFLSPFVLWALGFLDLNYTSTIPFVVFGLFFLIFNFIFITEIAHPFFIVSSLFFLQSGLGLFFNPADLDIYGYSIDYKKWIIWVYSLSIVILMLPLLIYKKIKKIELKRSFLFDFVLTRSWPFIYFSFIYLAPFAISSLIKGAEVVRTQTIYEEGVLPSSPLTTIAVGVAHFYGVFILLWFYSKVFNFGKFYSTSMLFGALCGLLWGLVYSARDILIWIPITFIFGYWLFKNHLSERERSKFISRMKTFPLFLIAIFGVFTFQRFSDSHSGVGGSIIEYFGVQPYVFLEMVTSHEYFYGLSLRFPFFAEIFGVYEPIKRTVPYEWQFGTLLVDFYSIAGWGGYFITIIIFLAFGYISGKSSCKSYLYPMASIFMMLYFITLTQGLFYFRLGSAAGNQFILISLLAALIFGKSKKQK